MLHQQTVVDVWNVRYLFGKSELEGELNSSQEDEKNSINQKNHSTGDSPEKEECMDGLITAAKAASDDEIADAVRDVYIGERLNKKRKEDFIDKEKAVDDDSLPDLEDVNTHYDTQINLNEEARKTDSSGQAYRTVRCCHGI